MSAFAHGAGLPSRGLALRWQRAAPTVLAVTVERTGASGDEADAQADPGRDRLHAAAGLGCLLIVLGGVALALIGAFAELRAAL